MGNWSIEHMCKKEVYDELKKLKWGNIKNVCVSSWAIWNAPKEGDTKRTSNMTGKNIFKDESFIEHINTDYVFIGLNASCDSDDYLWASFHKQGSNDYKLRYALQGTKYWGSYITDVIKELPDNDPSINISSSQDVVDYLKEHKEVIDQNIEYLKKELNCFTNKPRLVAMGISANELLNEYLSDEYCIIKIPHYAAYISKENYRRLVLEALNNRRQAIDFLICCYFGQSQDLIDAAINRAYVDMAAHTMRGFGDTKNEIQNKWKCRYNSSKLIKDALKKYTSGTCFNEWHEKLVCDIQNLYVKKNMSYGQAQKWLNMTIKYLYILRTILGEEDHRLSCVKGFLQNTSVSDYYPPVDSYVLKGGGVKCYASWSSMDKSQYDVVKRQMGDEKDFMWELEMWESFSREFSDYDRKSYAYFLKKEHPDDEVIAIADNLMDEFDEAFKELAK